jgi:hypothetical protein
MTNIIWKFEPTLKGVGREATIDTCTKDCTGNIKPTPNLALNMRGKFDQKVELSGGKKDWTLL